MTSAQPAPLLPVAIAFAVGSFIGLETGNVLDATWWLVLCAVIAAAWGLLCFKQRLIFANVFLLLLAVSAGGFHGSLRETRAMPGDLRLLPEDKFAPSCEWRGTVSSDPKFRPRKDRDETGSAVLIVELDGWRTPPEDAADPANENAPWQPVHGFLQVRINNSAPDRYHYGDTLIVTGALQIPLKPGNPGQFDMAAYLSQHEIYYSLRAEPDAVQIVANGAGNWFVSWAWTVRDWAVEKLQLGVKDDPLSSQITEGLVLGYIDPLPPEIESAFRNTGTNHIFAVSGQDVAVVLGVGLVALQMAGLVRWRWGWVLVPVIVFYCLTTGARPSAIRACLMAMFVLAAWWSERPASSLNLWSLALLMVTSYDAKSVISLSFQFSFIVVGALIVLTPPIYRILTRPLTVKKDEVERLPVESISPWRERLLRMTRATFLLLASSLAAWIGSVPLMLWYFHQLTFIGLLANLIVIPLSSLIVAVGLVSLAMALVSNALAAAVNNANWLLVKALLWFVTTLAQVPGGFFYLPPVTEEWHPTAPEFICTQNAGTSILLVRYENKAWLVNTGSAGVFAFTTDPLRKYYGVNRIDRTILAELSAVQSGGVPVLLSERIAQSWAIPPTSKKSRAAEPWLETMQQRGQSPQTWKRGFKETLAPDFTVTVLAPHAINDARHAEDRGLVLLFRYKNRSLLYAGRIGNEAESEILRSGLSPQADVLVQGHHSTEPNFDTTWLRAVSAKDVILAAPPVFDLGRFDSFELLEDAERPRVWRLEETGAVTIRLKDGGIDVIPFFNTPELSADKNPNSN